MSRTARPGQTFAAFVVVLLALAAGSCIAASVMHRITTQEDHR